MSIRSVRPQVHPEWPPKVDHGATIRSVERGSGVIRLTASSRFLNFKLVSCVEPLQDNMIHQQHMIACLVIMYEEIVFQRYHPPSSSDRASTAGLPHNSLRPVLSIVPVKRGPLYSTRESRPSPPDTLHRMPSLVLAALHRT